jgi:hypothetical protein
MRWWEQFHWDSMIWGSPLAKQECAMSDRDPLWPPRLARLRRRAEELWKKAGRPPGRDDEFWRQAEREIDAEAGARHDPDDPRP